MLDPIRSAAVLCLLLCVVAVEAVRADSKAEQTMSQVADMLSGKGNNVAMSAKRLLNPPDYDKLFEEVGRIHKQTSGALVVDVRLSKEPPPRLVSIASRVVQRDKAETAPITWAMLQEAMDQAAEQGFCGAVLVTRNGSIVLNEGYGFANREQQIENTPDTVFAIGSAPIDFTHAAILLLKDQGKLHLEDPITKFLTEVPEDKAAITIKHLMTGRSGFPDFHELPTDENPDHDWIDRDEAIRRIMNQKLLFKPGKGRRASHSAWGLLAAIIEIVSGDTYPEFTTKNLFEPAGMNDTGFFGDAVPVDRVAVGYGMASSTPNSPPHWGKTSWLVMGSGGQVATLADMYRFEVAMRNGSILSAESTAAFLRTRTGVCQDGDQFGFEFIHSTNPEQLFMIISNTIATRADRRSFARLGRRLEELTKSAPK